MLNDSILLQEYIEKCRFCLEDTRLGAHSAIIDEKIENLFSDLTHTKLDKSSTLSQAVCTECLQTFDSIFIFAAKLRSKQNFLLNVGSSEEKEEVANNELEEIKIEQQPEFLNVISTFEALSPEDVQPSETANRFRKKKQHRPNDDYPNNACPECGKKFTEKRKIPLHIKRIHVKIKDFHCDQCDYSAYTAFDIVRHVKNIHTKTENPADKRICPECGKVVRGNNQLTLHIRKKHLNIKKFQCDFCPFASYGKYEIRSHLEHMHIPKEFKESYSCSMCPSVLSSAMGLKVHIQHKHSGLKPHACFCGKSFSLRETLKTHIRNVHKGERKFACQYCPKRFGQAVRLRDHINNNHGTKQEIPCSKCEKVFHSSRNLKAHEIYHNDPKHSCDHCGKKFYLTNKLKEHLKTHEGSAEHLCNYCSRTFQLLSSLKRHVKNHMKSFKKDN